MTINWKSAARAFRLRSEADRMMLDTARESLAMLRDERSDAEFDSWEDAARHWWERMRQAERERDELLQKLEELRAELREKSGQVFRLAQRIDERELAHLRSPSWRDSFDEKCAPLREMTDKEWGDMSEQPSNIPVEFADLAARIEKADEKHQGDSSDCESLAGADMALEYARRRLRDTPTWENALLCELAEAIDAAFRGYTDAFADELLDVATVAMRWRRAVLERESK